MKLFEICQNTSKSDFLGKRNGDLFLPMLLYFWSKKSWKNVVSLILIGAHLGRSTASKMFRYTSSRSVKIAINRPMSRIFGGPRLPGLFWRNFDFFGHFCDFLRKKDYFLRFLRFFHKKWFFDIFWFFEMVLEPVSAGNSSPRSGKKRQNRAKKSDFGSLWCQNGVFRIFRFWGQFWSTDRFLRKIFWLLEELDLFEICQNQV